MVRLQFDLTVALSRSSLDARRGVVRVHPYVLDVMRMRAWDPLEVRGLRTTAALAAARDDAEESVIFMDELTCTNAGAAPGSIVSVGRAEVVSAVAVELSGVPSEDLEPELLRLALLGKVVGVGDGVALIPQDFSRPRHASDDLHRVVSAFHRSLGEDWQSVDVEVARTDPRGLVRITMETRIELDGRLVTATSSTPLGDAAAGEWPGLEDQLARLTELFDLSFNHSELLARLGTAPQLGVLVTGLLDRERVP
jgi:transitional endoplasmic reticulum ATPase